MSRTIPLLLTALCCILLKPTCCSSSKILVVPIDGSHWINMEVILQELHSRGHNITVLRSAKSWYIPSTSSLYTSINVPMLEDESDMDYYNRMLRDVMECRKWISFTRTFCQQYLITSIAAATMMDDPVFMKTLQDAKFDLMLTDPGLTLGVFLGAYLKLPMVFNVRWINNGESHFTMAPSPTSYVPVPGSELQDQMNFLERTKNMLHYIYSRLEQHFSINIIYTDLLQRHFPPGTDLLSLEYAADIWLVRADFVFEFPRPTMPNVIYIGGFQCKKARPLPAELEAFMQSSGEHGVVVMSLGTFVSALPPDVTDAIAAAFAEIPQKVVWKFIGEKPSSLGNNTLLVNWLPQNDLLGHPKTRAFVAHGGTNGVYESIYHGVPVLGLPLLFDQFDNLHRLKMRGAARVVEAYSLTKEDFLVALRDILDTPSYRNNMQHLSKLHHDLPMAPMDSAIFWIEYVIRNKGAAHLKSAGINLPWYTYFCVDVAVVIMVVLGVVVWASVSICRMLCCRSSRRKIKSE
ncbi:UDP-glucuronosyltransferase 2B15-like isoform X2 [Echeneis naucrates]|uniref:UDP-glucuronosyltransferase 2B15-like isoform X2 n=1 Tax=Echeneis naucrates TaxID=173247 RepID=UPI001113493B|nr:UDP-glucuronosyltransferase 2B15-like isoform X2 [Echeneis naucrates]